MRRPWPNGGCRVKNRKNKNSELNSYCNVNYQTKTHHTESIRFGFRYYQWFVWALVSEPRSCFVLYLGKRSKSTLDVRNKSNLHVTGCQDIEGIQLALDTVQLRV